MEIREGSRGGERVDEGLVSVERAEEAISEAREAGRPAT